MSDVTINTKGLDQLLKALKASPPRTRVGILGSKAYASHTGSHNEKNPPSNSTIGAAHEFGTSKMERRSFLREPIADHLEKRMEDSSALDQDVLNEVIHNGSILPWMKKIAIIAESIVAGAFQTGGYGKWAPWKNSTYSNNTGQILVDTTQLRNSISSEVEDA